MRTDYPATWFRLYAEFASDPKVQMLSESDQRRYVMLLCLRCSNGHVTLQDSEVSFQLRISNDEWEKTKQVLMQKNLIDNDNKPVAWDKRQRASDSSTERVSRHRANKKINGNGGVTLQKRQVETETETETETEKRKKHTPPNPRKRGDECSPEFLQFWQAYPRKASKPTAQKAWGKVCADTQTFAAIMSGLERANRSEDWQRDEGRYIPHPSTWLNQRRWEDEGLVSQKNTVQGRRCHCGADGITMRGGKWYCHEHEPTAVAVANVVQMEVKHATR